MRLIFAYIENFKNIKKQSFNFDSKYKCKYDYKNRMLEIEKNEHNIKIFSESIVFNVIVGQNGSGKTSLIEFLMLMFFNSEEYKETLEGFVLLEENEKIYISYYGMKNVAFKKINGNININKNIITYDNENFYFKNQISKNRFRNIHYNPSYELVSSTFLKYTPKELREFDAAIYDYEFKPFDNINLISYPFKKKSIFDIKFNEKFAVIMMFKIADYIQHNKIKDILSKKIFFIPSRVLVELNKNNVKNAFIKSYVDNEKVINFFNNINISNISLVELFKIVLLGVINVSHILNNEYTQYFFEKNGKVNQFLKILFNQCVEYRKKNFFTITVEQIMEFLLTNVDNEELETLLENVSLSNELRDNFDSTLNLEISRMCRLIDLLKNQGYSSLPLELNISKDDNRFIIEFLKFLPLSFDIKIFDENNVIYNDFSFGEKSVIALLSTILYFVLFMKGKSLYYNVFIDEMEIGLNPEWQRKLIKILFDAFNNIVKKYKIKINFIIATHSPFILSDVPKSNVVFLENGQNINKFNINEDTFGANIYDIFEKGFFLENSIGKYSEEMIKAIDLILSFYNAFKIAKEDNNIFLLRNLLNRWYISENEELNEKEIKKQDEELLDESKEKLLIKLFEKNEIEYEKFKFLIDDEYNLKSEIENYIKIIGDEVIRNHLVNLYESLKDESK